MLLNPPCGFTVNIIPNRLFKTSDKTGQVRTNSDKQKINVIFKLKEVRSSVLFKEFVQGLYPHCGQGLKHGDFVIAVLGNIVEENDNGTYEILNIKPDTANRYYKGVRTLPAERVTEITSSLDKQKFVEWISNLPDDSITNLTAWLSSKGYICNKYMAPQTCADILEKILFDIIADDSKTDDSTNTNPSNMNASLKRIEQIETLIEGLEKPVEFPVPETIQPIEEKYIRELYAAYGDAEGIVGFSEQDLTDYDEYEEDFADRRIDYFAAESIHRAVKELGTRTFGNQFDVLKDETLSGVKDTERKRFPNGYERMLAVMEKAVDVPVNSYLLSRSPYWINNKIKKGVCHFLVTDEKLHWVKRPKKGS